jgi:uncharacterized phiE125 gp8 family phage protein
MMSKTVGKWSWAMTVAPTVEPISLTEAKQHARITQDNDDAMIQRFIVTAREQAEDYMNRGIMTQTWQMSARRVGVDDLPARAAPCSR